MLRVSSSRGRFSADLPATDGFSDATLSCWKFEFILGTAFRSWTVLEGSLSSLEMSFRRCCGILNRTITLGLEELFCLVVDVVVSVILERFNLCCDTFDEPKTPLSVVFEVFEVCVG